MLTNGVSINDVTNAAPDPATKEMIDAGVFYGRKKSKTNPRMRQYVLANRGGIDIINLAKSADGIAAATVFLKEKAKAGALMLFVGTQPAAEEVILRLAKKFNAPYVTNRWVGGTMTNFKVISKRVEQFKKMRSDLKTGALVDKYTKKERLDIEKTVAKLSILLGGLEELAKEPDVLVLIDPTVHDAAVREARRLRIPVVALANVDSDPDIIDYLVPGNNQSKLSIEWFFAKVESAIEEGARERSAAQTAAAAALAAEVAAKPAA